MSIMARNSSEFISVNLQNTHKTIKESALLTWNITGLLGKDIDGGILLGVLLYEIDEVLERGAISLSKVEDFIIIGSINSTDNTIDNIIDVRIITRGGPIAKLLNGLST